MRLKLIENSLVYMIKILKPHMTVGRSRKADIKINCQHTSGIHCSFRFDSTQGLFVQDEGTMNGTFVNESAISQENKVYIGDIIRVGTVTIEIDPNKLSRRELAITSKNPPQ